MTIPKIKTTVYSHKVIDVVKFSTSDTSDWEIEEMFQDLLIKIMECSETSGLVHIKVDRPLSTAEYQHRMGVVAKNVEKKEKRRGYYSSLQLSRERAEYERLKKKFES